MSSLNHSKTYETITFGEIRSGDYVRTPSGDAMVLEAYEEHIPQRMFEIETDEGETVLVSGNHLFYVESSIDRALHKQRVKEGKKFFGSLDGDSETILNEYAHMEDMQEVTLKNFLEYFSFTSEKQIQAVARVFESIGHVSENTVKGKDPHDSDSVEPEIISYSRGYDVRRASQQLLSLTGKRKYTKKWPLIVGRVVTTIELKELHENFDVVLPDVS